MFVPVSLFASSSHLPEFGMRGEKIDVVISGVCKVVTHFQKIIVVDSEIMGIPNLVGKKIKV